jgi:hypothetical protein
MLTVMARKAEQVLCVMITGNGRLTLSNVIKMQLQAISREEEAKRYAFRLCVFQHEQPA